MLVTASLPAATATAASAGAGEESATAVQVETSSEPATADPDEAPQADDLEEETEDLVPQIGEDSAHVPAPVLAPERQPSDPGQAPEEPAGADEGPPPREDVLEPTLDLRGTGQMIMVNQQNLEFPSNETSPRVDLPLTLNHSWFWGYGFAFCTDPTFTRWRTAFSVEGSDGQTFSGYSEPTERGSDKNVCIPAQGHTYSLTFPAGTFTPGVSYIARARPQLFSTPTDGEPGWIDNTHLDWSFSWATFVAAGVMSIASPSDGDTVTNPVQVTGYGVPGELGELRCTDVPEASPFTVGADGTWSADCGGYVPTGPERAVVATAPSGSATAVVSVAEVPFRIISPSSGSAVAASSTVTVTGVGYPGATVSFFIDEVDTGQQLVIGDTGTWVAPGIGPFPATQGSVALQARQTGPEESTAEVDVTVNYPVTIALPVDGAEVQDPVRVVGSAWPGQHVALSLAWGATLETAQAGADGVWVAVLTDLPAGSQRITVTSENGQTAQAQVTVIPVPLQIVSEPEDALALVGEQASFTVVASGTGPLTVRWQVSVDGGSMWRETDEATSTEWTFTTPTLTPDHDGYRFRAVVTGPAGNVASRGAGLTVVDPVVITDPVEGQRVLARPVASGTHSPGARVDLTATHAETGATTELGGAESDAAGAWTVTSEALLEAGDYQLTATGVHGPPRTVNVTVHVPAPVDLTVDAQVRRTETLP